jgi:hypothetical protein
MTRAKIAFNNFLAFLFLFQLELSEKLSGVDFVFYTLLRINVNLNYLPPFAILTIPGPLCRTLKFSSSKNLP